MQDWRYRLARLIIHLRIYVILFFTGLSIFFICILKDIKVETHLGDFYPQRHSFIRVQNKLTSIFGGLNQVSIALRTKKKDIFDRNFLNKVISITDELYLMDGVNHSRITSLSSRNTKYVTFSKEGFFVERLLRDVPETEEEMQAFKTRVKNNPAVYKRIVSEDFKSTLIQVDFEHDAATSYIFNTLQSIKRHYEDANTEIYLAGRPVLEGWLNFYLPKMFSILLFSVGVISIVLYFTFRSKRGVILPLLDSAVATLCGLGAMDLIGLRLDPSTILVPFIVLSLGISHSVHTLKRYYEEMKKPRMKSKHAVINTMSYLFVPGLACVLTDGFGFLSLSIVPISTIRSMAFASGVGILANFFTSFMFTPAILSFLHKPRVLEIEREERHVWVDNFLKKLSIFSVNRNAGTVIVVLFIIFAVLSFAGISKIVIGDNTKGTSYLYPGTPYNRAESFINSHFGGTNSYYVLVDSQDSLLESVWKLKKIDSLERYLLTATPQAGYGYSIADAIKPLNFFVFSGDEDHFIIPDNDKTVAEYWFLYTLTGFPGDFDYLISRDETKANIKIDLKDHKSDTVDRIVRNTQQWLKENMPAGSNKGLKFYYGGGDIGILFAINDIVRKTIFPNILLITLLIFIYVSIVYRSFAAGGMLLIPLVFSNLIVFSLFGFLKTSITTDTLPLASLSEGLGINYGIYIIARLFEEMRNKRSTYRNILYGTLITSGKAVFFSGFIVSSGILVWVFSPILLQARLGVNLCLSLLLNMITSLVVLPVLVWWIKPYFLFGRVKVKLRSRVLSGRGEGRKYNKGR